MIIAITIKNEIKRLFATAFLHIPLSYKILACIKFPLKKYYLNIIIIKLFQKLKLHYMNKIIFGNYFGYNSKL